MLSTVTTKGQVTIPVGIRERFGIRPNDKVDFLVDGDRISLVPVRALKDLRGVVTTKGVGDFRKERVEAKARVARRVRGEMS